MIMDGRALGKEACENAKEIVSKYGVKIVCDEEDLTKKPDVVLPERNQMLCCQQANSAKI